jgi:hypothetical protein
MDVLLTCHICEKRQALLADEMKKMVMAEKPEESDFRCTICGSILVEIKNNAAITEDYLWPHVLLMPPWKRLKWCWKYILKGYPG